MFTAPYFSFADVQKKAEAFLDQYHPTREIPVPIEEIIDNSIGLHIFPFPNLYRKFEKNNGFLSKDRMTIYVDEYQYLNYPYKYRFTLAHEIGHYVLHQQIYEEIPCTTLEEYIHWRSALSAQEVNWLETHAYWFAGCVLLPSSRLEEACQQILTEAKPPFSEEMWQSDSFWEYAANNLTDIFEVSPSSIAAQIKKDHIVDKLRETFSKR